MLKNEQKYTTVKSVIEDFYKKSKIYCVEKIEGVFIEDVITKLIFTFKPFLNEELSKQIRLIVCFKEKLCVYKLDSNNRYIEFYRDELEFFDKHGYAICEEASNEIKQDVEDWYDMDERTNDNLSDTTENLMSFLSIYTDDTGNEVPFTDLLDKIKKLPKSEQSEVFTRHVRNDMKKKSSYIPNRITALSIVVGYELNVIEGNNFLHDLGFHLSDKIEYDRIISDSIKKEYGIFETNLELLKVINKTSRSNDPEEKYRYWKHLLGSPKAKKEAQDYVLKNN